MSDKLLEKRISLLDDWVFKAVIGNPDDLDGLLSFFRAVDPALLTLRLFPEEQRVTHPDAKAIRYDICGIINEEIYFDLEVQQREVRMNKGSGLFSIYLDCLRDKKQKEWIIAN